MNIQEENVEPLGGTHRRGSKICSCVHAVQARPACLVVLIFPFWIELFNYSILTSVVIFLWQCNRVKYFYWAKDYRIIVIMFTIAKKPKCKNQPHTLGKTSGQTLISSNIRETWNTLCEMFPGKFIVLHERMGQTISCRMDKLSENNIHFNFKVELCYNKNPGIFGFLFLFIGLQFC